MNALRTVTLGEIVRESGGVVQTGPFGSQLHASDYVPEGVPLVMPVNMGDNVIREEGIARVGEDDVRRLSRHRLRAGDIVFSRRGDVGRRSIVRSSHAGWLCGTGCLAVKFGSNLSRVNPEFVSLFIGTRSAQEWLVDNAVGGTMLNLNTSILAALPLHLPDRAEQDAIVGALSDAYAEEVALEFMVSKKRDIKQGLMQEMLTGRVRLSGFSAPWREVRVDEVALITKGQQLGRSDMVSGGTVEVWNGGVEPSGFTDGANVNSVVVTVSEGGNSCGWVGPPRSNFWLGGHCYALNPLTDRVSPDFLYQALKAREPNIMGLRTGSGLPNIQKRALAKFLIGIPDDASEATSIAGVLADADREIEALVRRLEVARAIKQGMMQELLTGRTRLVAEGVAA